MKQQNFDSEFEELIREKVTENQQDPESLLWKRLQDQLRYNDDLARNKKRRFFLFSSALFVVSIGIGMLVGNVKWVGDLDKQRASALKQTTKTAEKSSVKITVKTNTTQKKINNKTTAPVQPTNENLQVQHVQQMPHHAADWNEGSNHVNIDLPSEDKANVIESPVVFAMNSEQSPMDKVDLPHETNVSQTPDEHQSLVEEESSNPELEVSQEITLPFQHVDAKQINPNASIEMIPAALSGNLSLTMNLSPAYTDRRARDHSSGSALNAAHFNAAESGKVVMKGGLGVMYSFTPLFSMRGGVQLSTYRTAYSVSNELVYTDTVAKLVHIESAYGQMQLPESDFHPSGSQNPDEEEPEEIDTLSILLSYSNVQTFRMIQVPVAFEFGIQQGKWRYIAGAGLTYGYTAAANSNFVADGYSPIRTDVRSLFKRNSLSGAVHVGIEYAILPKLSVRATPSFTYMLTKMNHSSTISTHGFWGGVDLELRFNL